MKWEYQVVNCHINDEWQKLDDAGAAGWELVSASIEGFYRIFYFKRAA